MALMTWAVALAGLATLIAWSASYEFGLLHHLHLPEPAATVLVLLCFDAWMYLWHRLNQPALPAPVLTSCKHQVAPDAVPKDEQFVV